MPTNYHKKNTLTEFGSAFCEKKIGNKAIKVVELKLIFFFSLYFEVKVNFLEINVLKQSTRILCCLL